MSRGEIIELLKKSWTNIEELLVNHPVFSDDKSPQRSISWDSNSAIRKMGSEAYLQALFFSEINKVCKNINDDFIISVEGKQINGKRPDLLGWDIQSGQGSPFFVVELKVTGTDFIESSKKNEGGIFFEELKNYSTNELIRKGEVILFICCYYESNPDDILNIIGQYNSLLNWIMEVKDIKFPEQFVNNVLEGYGFRDDKWQVIDNQKT